MIILTTIDALLTITGYSEQHMKEGTENGSMGKLKATQVAFVFLDIAYM
jgi:hypothetical protein